MMGSTVSQITDTRTGTQDLFYRSNLGWYNNELNELMRRYFDSAYQGFSQGLGEGGYKDSKYQKKIDAYTLNA